MSIVDPIKRFLARMIPTEIEVFPSIETELADVKPLLKGRVLNAGAGWRDLSHLIDGELVNQDIPWPGDKRTNIQIFSALDHIPVESCYFDTILCIAVLEHVENPYRVLSEFYRVLKTGGHLILDVPFLQPEHKVPTDYQRYTKDGLVNIITKHGFRVVKVTGLFSVYHTLYWQIHIWLHLKRTMLYRFLRLALLHPLLFIARRSRVYSDRLATGFQVVATKD